jgi:hypothetical protein
MFKKLSNSILYVDLPVNHCVRMRPKRKYAEKRPNTHNQPDGGIVQARDQISDPMGKREAPQAKSEPLEEHEFLVYESGFVE